MLKWIEAIRFVSSGLIGSRNDQGSICAGASVTSDAQVSSDASSNCLLTSKLQPNNRASHL